MRLRSQFIVLTLAVLVPVAAFATVLVVRLIGQERDTFRRGAQERTLAMSTAMDTALISSVTTLQALATLPTLDEGDLKGFRSRAERVLAIHPDWSNINLALPSGQQVLNLLRPPGDASLPDISRIDPNWRQAVESRRPFVSDLITGPVTGQWDFAVRVPVIREGQVKYVLSAVVKPEAIGALLARQGVPPDWVAVVLDGADRIVARTVDPEKSAGEFASQSLREALARSPSGWFRGSTIEGAKVYTPYRRSPDTGWVFAMGIPARVLDAPGWRAGGLLALGLAASVGIAVVLAMLVGRRIQRPIASLAAGSPAQTGIEEIAALGAALREKHELAEREKGALQAADRAKDEFLAMLSHELRNPLAALSAAAHVVKLAAPGSDAGVKARAVIERQTRHMARLIGDLLDVSRVAMGKVALERERVDLARVVSGVVGIWRASGRLERHAVTVEAAPAWVDADRARLEQIFSNLLDNALKFTPAGGRVAVSVRQEGDVALLRVADEGEGLAPGMLGRMFDLFVQGERGLDRAAGGMGVGLALVKRLTELHGGTVSAMSPGIGQGATFIVTLPAVLPTAEQAAPAELVAAAPRRVLIVEDNDDTRQMLHETLAFSGHEVREARDGASALALAAESRPDVALIDIGLPDLDGYELARRLRAAPGGRRMGLVALTGYGQAEDQRRAFDAGFDAHLTKPVAPERLKQVMARL